LGGPSYRAGRESKTLLLRRNRPTMRPMASTPTGRGSSSCRSGAPRPPLPGGSRDQGVPRRSGIDIGGEHHTKPGPPPPSSSSPLSWARPGSRLNRPGRPFGRGGFLVLAELAALPEHVQERRRRPGGHGRDEEPQQDPAHGHGRPGTPVVAIGTPVAGGPGRTPSLTSTMCATRRDDVIQPG
jgi:hypothetical protein